MSADAREAVLARVRSALATPGTPRARADGPPATGAGLAVPTDRAEILDLFALRVVDYRAVVDRVLEGDLGAAVARALATHGATSAVAPTGLDPGWFEPARAAGVTVSSQDEVTHDRRPDAAALDAVVGVVTTADVGIAVTGTIVLAHGPGQGPRALTLVPDLHVCVVRADQVVADVPEATERLADSVRAGRPLTWISGPSATSDIELERVEGVHGPRTLHVLIVDAE
ncbi:MAG: lactate utilization protein C [Humibacillus sp.]|nr:lactate utilization protein C [Humibacillus sp.]MDN5779146.1 lactate utilization protein C [Humibacillus sp.]